MKISAKALITTGISSLIISSAMANAGTPETTYTASAGKSVATISHTVATDLAASETYTSVRQGGYKWGAKAQPSTSSNEAWVARDQTASGFIWNNQNSLTNSNDSVAGSSTSSWSTMSTPEQAGYRWGIKNFSDQAGYRWGIKNFSDQAGYRWGIKNFSDQAGYRWGIKNFSDQAGYRWGIKNFSDQAGYRWGIKNFSDQAGYRWGIKNFSDQAGYRWGIKNFSDQAGYRWGIKNFSDQAGYRWGIK